jgi:hypothetical protein
MTQRLLTMLRFAFVTIALAAALLVRGEETLISGTWEGVEGPHATGVGPDPQMVHRWTVGDVERWMNWTVGYPEYAAVVTENLVDGPTLLALDRAETFFANSPVKVRPLHLAKLRAHLALLRRWCLCPSSGAEFAAAASGPAAGAFSAGIMGTREQATDVWSAVRVRPVLTTALYFGAIFSPRATLLLFPLIASGDYFAAAVAPSSGATVTDAVDDEIAQYQGLLRGVDIRPTPSAAAAAAAPASLSWFGFTLYFLAAVFLPNALLAYGVLRHFWTHPILSILFAATCLCIQASELGLLYETRTAVAHGATTWRAMITRSLKEGALNVFNLVPLVAVVLAWMLPSWLTSALMVAAFLFVLMVLVRFVFIIGNYVIRAFGGGGDAASGEEEPKEKTD